MRTGKQRPRPLLSGFAVCLAVALNWAPTAKARNPAQQAPAAHSESGIKATRRATRLRLIDFAGYREILTEHRGHPLLVTFWATWCEPCQTEFPMINHLARKYGPKGLEVVGISLDQEADLNVERDFLRKMKPVFPSYRKQPGNDDEFNRRVAPDWDGAIPATAYYARDGRLEAFTVGQNWPGDLEESLERLLATPAN